MKSKLFAITFSLLLTLVIFFGIDNLTCTINPCLDDDASRLAMTMLGIPLLILYILITCGIMYPTMLSSRKHLGQFVSPLVVTVSVTFLLALIFHDPQVDDTMMDTIFVFLSPLGIAWYFGGLTATSLWPNKSDGTNQKPEGAF
ncbi:hypothetical protein LOH54_02805 [Sulfurimonas sp. HSL-3221]|uniref:hypothetical protein n=1 Tax=Sulfurimonadaceae TaxID=2771471 RepID=UPI001E46B410|nr:hypothetical protein [Sulfurimonas sp. HSL-3221]UFS63064.1 hypothetical protein LOH54_02805 [Sulfurimonas sp. HSL-3221]